MLTSKNQKAKYHLTVSLKKSNVFGLEENVKTFQYLCFEFFLW